MIMKYFLCQHIFISLVSTSTIFFILWGLNVPYFCRHILSRSWKRKKHISRSKWEASI